MSQAVLAKQSAAFEKPIPEIRPGFTIRVHEKIQEKGRERIQVFEGLVIAVHGGAIPTDSTFTVRRIVSGVGVEKVFPFYAPNLVKIEVVKVAKVRRSKLYFLRGRQGKAARLSERFTTSGEFSISSAPSKKAGDEKAEEVSSAVAEKEHSEEMNEEKESGAKKQIEEATTDTTDPK